MPRGKIYHTDLNVESDDYGEIVHFHFDPCPVCGGKNAPTDQYCDPDMCVEDEDEICCGICGSKFRMLSYKWFSEEGKEAKLELQEDGKD